MRNGPASRYGLLAHVGEVASVHVRARMLLTRLLPRKPAAAEVYGKYYINQVSGHSIYLPTTCAHADQHNCCLFRQELST